MTTEELLNKMTPDELIKERARQLRRTIDPDRLATYGFDTTYSKGWFSLHSRQQRYPSKLRLAGFIQSILVLCGRPDHDEKS